VTLSGSAHSHEGVGTYLIHAIFLTVSFILHAGIQHILPEAQSAVVCRSYMSFLKDKFKKYADTAEIMPDVGDETASHDRISSNNHNANNKSNSDGENEQNSIIIDSDNDWEDEDEDDNFDNDVHQETVKETTPMKELSDRMSAASFSLLLKTRPSQAIHLLFKMCARARYPTREFERDNYYRRCVQWFDLQETVSKLPPGDTK
jgi:hypothetical protein